MSFARAALTMSLNLFSEKSPSCAIAKLLTSMTGIAVSEAECVAQTGALGN